MRNNVFLLRNLFVATILGFVLISNSLKAEEVRKGVTVTVSEVTHSSFKVLYAFDQPVRSFNFQNDDVATRSTNWLPITTGIKFSSNVVKSYDNTEFRNVEFLVDIKTQKNLRKNDPFLIFSDGANAIFSEYLLLNHDDFRVKFKLIPSLGQFVIIAGTPSSLPAQWEPPREPPFVPGTYFYFGASNLTKRDNVKYLFDNEVPKWVKEEITVNAPKIVKFYRQKMGGTTKIEPSVFVTISDLDDAGYGNNGSSLSGQFIRLNLKGSGWRAKTEDKQRKIRILLAHELFHIWNTEISMPDLSEATPWIHEGSAEYMSWKSLVSLNLLPQQASIDLINNAMNRCVLGLSLRTLSQISHQATEQQQFYDCGALIFYLIDQYQIEHVLKNDLYVFLRDIFNERKYSSVSIFNKLSEQSGSSSLLGFLHKLTGKDTAAFERELSVQLSKLKQVHNLLDVSKDKELYIDASIGNILRRDCSRGVGYWSTQEGIRIDSDNDCQSFPDFPTIISVMGISINERARSVYQEIFLKCGTSDGTIQMKTSSGKYIEYSCTTPIPRLPAEIYLQ